MSIVERSKDGEFRMFFSASEFSETGVEAALHFMRWMAGQFPDVAERRNAATGVMTFPSNRRDEVLTALVVSHSDDFFGWARKKFADPRLCLSEEEQARHRLLSPALVMEFVTRHGMDSTFTSYDVVPEFSLIECDPGAIDGMLPRSAA